MLGVAGGRMTMITIAEEAVDPWEEAD